MSSSTHTAPPSLISDTATETERTNTLALLLPHLALFEGPSLRLLKEHYSSFGNIAHWAPVKGFGRVIIVYETEDEAAYAKEEGDRLFLDVDLGEEVGRKGEGIGHKRRKSQPAHGYVCLLFSSLRLSAVSPLAETEVLKVIYGEIFPFLCRH